MTEADPKPQLLLATRNRGKLRELSAMLAPLGIEVLSLDQVDSVNRVPEVIEDADSFEGNAQKKALETSATTGLATLADDSGLCVDALGGAPGVYSARYAGPDASDADNNQKLLTALSEVPEPDRTARFVAVLALHIPPDAPGWHQLLPEPSAASAAKPATKTFRGTVEGRILTAPRGDHGFGYDPLFVAEGERETMAELTPAQKHAISHRGRATAQLLEFLQASRHA